MRVLFVQKYADTGGSKQSLLHTLELLEQRGHQPAVVTESEGEFSQGCRRLGIEVIEGWVPDYRKVKHRVALPLLLNPIVRKTRGRGFDWVISNEISWAPQSRHLARRIGARSGVIIRDSNANPTRIGKYRLRHLDRVLCVSEALRKIVNLPQARRVYNAIVPPEANDQAAPPKEMTPTRRWLLVIGKLSARKNQIAAIDVLAHLVDKGFDDLGLVLLGDSAGDARKTIISYIDERGLRDRILLPGHTRDIHPIIENCEALLLTSLREGLPRSLLEGLLLARPAYSTPLPGLGEIYGRHQDRFVSQSPAPEELADLIAAGLANAASTSAAVKEVQQRVSSRWSEEAHIAQFLEALDAAPKVDAASQLAS